MSTDLFSATLLHRVYVTSSRNTDSLRARRDHAIVEALEHGASYGEVARALGVPRATVQSVARKARSKQKDGRMAG